MPAEVERFFEREVNDIVAEYIDATLVRKEQTKNQLEDRAFSRPGLARDHQVLQNAAREGARFSSLPSNRMSGVTNPTTVETTIKNRIIAYLANERITVTAGDITVNQGFTMPLGTVNVPASEITITYTRPVLFPGIANWFALTTTVQGRAVFRNFY